MTIVLLSLARHWLVFGEKTMKALGWYGPVNEEQEKKGLGRQMEEDSRRGNAANFALLSSPAQLQ